MRKWPPLLNAGRYHAEPRRIRKHMHSLSYGLLMMMADHLILESEKVTLPIWMKAQYTSLASGSYESQQSHLRNATHKQMFQWIACACA